ncbi:MAG: PTS sugar transporter subunit IIA [Candidatus Zixiibacteriota bacterium]
MELRIRDAAKLFSVPENKIRQWIQDKGLPAQEVRGQYRLNRAEVLEWATENQIPLSSEIFAEVKNGTTLPSLAAALEIGGIFHNVVASDRESALRAVVKNLPLPEDADPEFLFEVLLARESLGSTGIGDGIAIPHVRNPVVLHVNQPIVSLCFLDTPIDFGAIDGQPVFALFGLISPTVRIHLHILSRLAFGLQDQGFKAAVKRKAPAAEILNEARRVEAAIERPTVGNSAKRRQ